MAPTTNGHDGGALQAIRYADGRLSLLDQRLLPLERVYLDVPDAKAAWQAIKVRCVWGGVAAAGRRQAADWRAPAAAARLRRTWSCAARRRSA